MYDMNRDKSLRHCLQNMGIEKGAVAHEEKPDEELGLSCDSHRNRPSRVLDSAEEKCILIMTKTFT